MQIQYYKLIIIANQLRYYKNIQYWSMPGKLHTSTNMHDIQFMCIHIPEYEYAQHIQFMCTYTWICMEAIKHIGVHFGSPILKTRFAPRNRIREDAPKPLLSNPALLRENKLTSKQIDLKSFIYFCPVFACWKELEVYLKIKGFSRNYFGIIIYI